MSDPQVPATAELLRQAEHLRAINQLTIELAGTRSFQDAIACTCARLRDMTGAKAVALSTFDPEARAVRVRELAADPELLTGLERILGTRPLDIVNPLGQFPPGDARSCRATVLSGIGAVFFDRLPAPVTERLELELGLGACYGLCLRYVDELIATMAVVMPPGAGPLSLPALEAFANVAAAALWQKLAKGKLQESHDQLDRRVRERSAELAERNRQLEEANLRLEQLGRARDEFAATVSHDLRTPLVTGIGHLELLADGAYGQLSLEGASAARTALRNLRRLANLVDDLLQYQRLALRGRLSDADLSPVDLTAMFRDCAEEFLFRTGWSDDQITIRAPAELPCALADEDLLRRAITNLLDNAGRHAGSLVHVSLTAALEPGGQVRVEVGDDGAGMPAEVLSHAFEPFAGQASGRAGAGLGLAIVRRACEAHGSTPQMLSGPGAGTRVWFSLRATAEHPRPAPAEPSASGTRGAGQRILLVDDDRDTLTFVRLVLARGGFAPVTATCGRDALAALDGGRCDLALLDISMPDMEGTELCRQIKSRPDCAGMPVHMFSARAEDSARRAAMEAGCDGYIVKPVPVSELLRLVGRACGAPGDYQRPGAGPTPSA